MSELDAALARISGDLRALGVRWAVGGGLALAILGLEASAVAHVAALLGWPLALGHGAYVLHFGVFLVAVPAFLLNFYTLAAVRLYGQGRLAEEGG